MLCFTVQIVLFSLPVVINIHCVIHGKQCERWIRTAVQCSHGRALRALCAINQSVKLKQLKMCNVATFYYCNLRRKSEKMNLYRLYFIHTLNVFLIKIDKIVFLTSRKSTHNLWSTENNDVIHVGYTWSISFKSDCDKRWAERSLSFIPGSSAEVSVPVTASSSRVNTCDVMCRLASFKDESNDRFWRRFDAGLGQGINPKHKMK